MALTSYLLSGVRLTTDAHDQRPRTDPTRSLKFRVFHFITIHRPFPHGSHAVLRINLLWINTRKYRWNSEGTKLNGQNY